MEKIGRLLAQRRQDGLMRTVHTIEERTAGVITIAGRRYLDFSSNDYLGLAEHPNLAAAGRDAILRWGTGAGASRLLSGSQTLHRAVEEAAAVFKGKERALVYNSGYQANLGIISALCGKQDVIFADRLAHASLLDGAQLSGARLIRFAHNDPEHLRRLLARERGNYRDALIVTESVFSMDGDCAPLAELVLLKQEYDCSLLVDEAHATGLFGARGSGLAEQAGATAGADMLMGTFSKALGSFGAYCAADQAIIEYLRNFSRAFIYSTALPPAVIAANLAALEVVAAEPERRRVLQENSDFFRVELIRRGYAVRGSTQIVPLIVGENERAVRSAQALQEKGYWVVPIRYPSVPRQEARLRFSLTYHHCRAQLQKLVEDIDAVLAV
ncbi:MAG: 8-amino-7-oxononanoate synthase [Candidatus Omnitrophica bacterium]|nr:8-amino-7-oxononanoate synthase [Candidatus Omnitrophota bacterium]